MNELRCWLGIDDFLRYLAVNLGSLQFRRNVEYRLPLPRGLGKARAFPNGRVKNSDVIAQFHFRSQDDCTSVDRALLMSSM